jgi:ubiquinone/menaquinone biosynthesis C-methylase UbiE
MELIQNNEKLINSFNKLANTYDEETNTFYHIIVEYIEKENLLKELPPPNNKIELLDLGGGTGKNSVHFSKLGYNVTLVDISDESLKIAETKFRNENLQIKIINTSGEALPMVDNSFDVIIMLGSVISYTPNPILLLKECYRILKSGGLLYLDFVNIYRFCKMLKDAELLLNILEKEEKLTQMGPEDYPVRNFKPKYMENLLIQEGFKIKTKYGSASATTSLPDEIKWGKKYRKDLLERYKKIELNLSRDPEYYGTSTLCSIVAKK